MYGTWFLIVMSLAGAVLLVIGLASAFAPLLAVAIALLVAAVVIYGWSARRSRQVGVEHATAAQERRRAGQAGRPTASAAPRSGEGDADAAHRVRATRGST